MLTSSQVTSTPILEYPHGIRFQHKKAKGTLEENLMQATLCNVVQEVDVYKMVYRQKMPKRYKVLNQAGGKFLDVVEEREYSIKYSGFRLIGISFGSP